MPRKRLPEERQRRIAERERLNALIARAERTPAYLVRYHSGDGITMLANRNDPTVRVNAVYLRAIAGSLVAVNYGGRAPIGSVYSKGRMHIIDVTGRRLAKFDGQYARPSHNRARKRIVHPPNVRQPSAPVMVTRPTLDALAAQVESERATARRVFASLGSIHENDT